MVIFQKNWHWNQWYLLWEPYLLFLGYHGKYNRGSSRGYWTQAWTVSNEDVLNGNIIGNNQAKWEDHPKVYPSWSKHANFDRPYRGPLDAIDQSTMSAYRSDEWWNFVDSNYYIRADSSTEAGQALLAADWQGATSVPPKVHEGICKIKAQYLHDELFVIPVCFSTRKLLLLRSRFAVSRCRPSFIDHT